jgi:hypothetical protein
MWNGCYNHYAVIPLAQYDKLSFPESRRNTLYRNQPDPDTDPHSRSHTDGNSGSADSHAAADIHIYAHSHKYSASGSHSYQHASPDSNTDSYKYADPQPDDLCIFRYKSHAYTYAHSHKYSASGLNRHADTNPDTNSDPHTCLAESRRADTHKYSASDCNTHPDTRRAEPSGRRPNRCSITRHRIRRTTRKYRGICPNRSSRTGRSTSTGPAGCSCASNGNSDDGDYSLE